MRRGTRRPQASGWMGVAAAWLIGLSVHGCDPKPVPEADPEEEAEATLIRPELTSSHTPPGA